MYICPLKCFLNRHISWGFGICNIVIFLLLGKNMYCCNAVCLLPHEAFDGFGPDWWDGEFRLDMGRYDDYQMQKILGYPIAGYLGLDLSSARARIMCRSPFNQGERTASFEIDMRRNLFHCFSTERKGGILELVMQLEGLRSHGEAVDFIGRELLGITPQDDVSPRRYTRRFRYDHAASAVYSPEPGGLRIRSLSRPVTDPSLVSYIAGRGVSEDIVNRYCMQVRYSTASHPDRVRTAISFANNKRDASGHRCLVLRGPHTKISSGQAETTIDRNGRLNAEPTSDTVLVFEGFYDFLSWLEYRGEVEPGVDVLVLNSVGNLSVSGEGKYSNDYISRHARIDVFLDGDAAGRRATEAIRALYSATSLVVDMSWIWEGRAKDLNDLLRSDPSREMTGTLTDI